MSGYPNRCQHIKVNGTQCGSPALRRNRFCFFHKRYRDEQIKLAADRKRQAKATFTLPVLDDANSIQVALMQVMRLLVSRQIEHKTASLLLYALQTASANLRQADFRPSPHEVILDPREAADSSFDIHLWEDDDFITEEEEEQDEIEKQADIAAEEARKSCRKRLEQERKQKKTEDYMRNWVNTHPGWGLKRENGILKYIKPHERKSEPVGTAALGGPAGRSSAAANPSEAKASVPNTNSAAGNPEPETSDEQRLTTPTDAEFEADLDAITRKHFLPVPESVLPKDWRHKKPAGSVREEKIEKKISRKK